MKEPLVLTVPARFALHPLAVALAVTTVFKFQTQAIKQFTVTPLAFLISTRYPSLAKLFNVELVPVVVLNEAQDEVVWS